MQLFVRINIEPEFEKSLYEEAPASIQGRESQHHDSNDLQMATPPLPQRKCPGVGGIIGLGLGTNRMKMDPLEVYTSQLQPP